MVHPPGGLGSWEGAMCLVGEGGCWSEGDEKVSTSWSWQNKSQVKANSRLAKYGRVGAHDGKVNGWGRVNEKRQG